MDECMFACLNLLISAHSAVAVRIRMPSMCLGRLLAACKSRFGPGLFSNYCCRISTESALRAMCIDCVSSMPRLCTVHPTLLVARHSVAVSEVQLLYTFLLEMRG